MSEEEKKAIEKIEDFLTTNKIVSISSDEIANSEELEVFISKNEYLAIEFIANMFLKQLKEIEKLKYKVREHICIEAHEQVKQLYVTKAKIKEKIKELEEEKNISEGMYIKAFYRIKDLKNIEIAVLESLLEED